MSMLQNALAFAARNWPVFPCHPDTKQPLVKGDRDADGALIPNSGGVKKASCDPDQVREWWTRWPNAMIGLPTGKAIGAFVVDVDAGEDKKTGEVYEAAALQLELEKQIGAKLPPTLFANTPRGGVHLYFALPAEGAAPGNRANIVKRVDVRGDGGYVIAPPSLRKDGKTYHWGVAHDTAPAIAPPALLDLIFRRGQFADRRDVDEGSGIGARAAAAVKRPPAGDSSIAAGDEAVRKYGLAALDAELQALRASQTGGRNDALNIAALKLAQLVAAGALHEGFVRAALEDAAAVCGLIKDDGLRGVRATIDSGFRKGKAQPRDLDEIRRAAAYRESRPRKAAVRTSSSPTAADSSSSDPLPRSPSGEKSDPQTLAKTEKGEAKDADDEAPPPDDTVSDDTFRFCAGLDQSDVDNGQRLIAYFGRDLLVRQEDDVPAGQMLAWTGTHWDLAGGEALAHLIGQRVGDLIKQEAGYIDFTPPEARAVSAGDAAAKELKDLDPDSDSTEERARCETLTELVTAAKKARAALSTRKTNRRKWGVSTKNAGRIAAMLKCAAPHLRRHPDAFNADPLKVATLTHTLTFIPIIDDEDPDPEGKRLLVDRQNGRVQYKLRAKRGHDRDDMLTAVIPFAYDPKATAKEFNVFLDLFQPEAKKRRTVQQYSGMSLTAQPVQRVMFHTGTGGNGKSVYLEVLARVFGDGLSAGVPAETVSGQVQNNPSAPTPDIARCYAKRYLRIAELPKDAPLKMETIKKLTGGERWPVRTMYKGYFEFKPTAKPHMSGNGEPKFDGADGGMKRRLIIVEWSVTLAEEKHRDFEDVVSGIVAEGSGILNWLIAGALDFLNSGLIISDDVLKTTADHFAEMDPCGQFVEAHVKADPGGPGVTGRAMYDAYKLWCEVNGTAKMFETRFGLTMKKKLKRDDTKRIRVYVDVALHDMPEVASHQSEHGPPHDHHHHSGVGDEPF
jgi:putative DNA primase/helicase